MSAQVIERVFDAPIALVWELWTTAAGVASWFGPHGFTVEVTEIELREGGPFVYTMRPDNPEKQPFTVSSTFTKVQAPHELTYDSPWGPEVMTTAVTFTEAPEGVKMVLTLSATKPEMMGGAAKGWGMALDKLADHLASAR